MKLLTALCVSFVLIGTSVCLANPKAQDPCENATTQSEINRCADIDYKQSDRMLNENYQMVRESMKESPAVLAQLKKAQLKWIEFRDAQCEFEALPFEGGSMQSATRLYCLARESRHRAETLEGFLETAGQ